LTSQAAVPESISYSSAIPPNLFILLAMVGILLAWRSRRWGLWLATAAMACLYLTSTPIVGYALTRSVDALAQTMPRVRTTVAPGAIVVLSAGYRHNNTPGSPDIVGPITRERLAEGIRQQRRLNLPILVSGGWVGGADDSLAGMMARSLQEEFRAPARWREDRSRTTFENALYSAEMLRRAGVPAAIVVTDPYHMARALWSFYRVGYSVVPASTPDRPVLPLSAGAFLPQVPALSESYLALHELIGLGWYMVRYGRW
jgi:uncharacterized SAM-binding protein YcdF (DUF218 family)